jgi:DNA replication protein DnaC
MPERECQTPGCTSTALVVGADSFSMPYPFCAECADERAADADADECAEQQRAEQERLIRAGATPKRMAWTLDTYPTDTDGAKRALAIGRRWGAGAVKWYRDGQHTPAAWEPYPNLVLIGGIGVGKSGLAWPIVRRCIEHDVPAMFATWAELLDDARRAVGERSRAPRMERAATVAILALDDLGAERSTEWGIGELRRVVEDRLQAGLPTIVTTNYDLGDLGRRLSDDAIEGGRIVSRLAECAEVCEWSESRDRRIGFGGVAAR